MKFDLIFVSGHSKQINSTLNNFGNGHRSEAAVRASRREFCLNPFNN
jgi:hypothetical protein